MKIEWVFDPAGHSMTKFRDMEEGIVQPTSTMSSLEILARENEQNLVDHPADPTKPTLCTYEVRKLSGSDKKNFYAALHMDKYTPHLKGAIKPPISGEPTADKMSADTTDDLDILIIRHDNGVGLIGGEFPGEGIDEKNFHALVKSYGLNDKGADGGGGSHGVGKNVYWQWSKHGIVLFYSSLSKDYNGHTRRFIGTGRVKVTHRTVSGGKKFLPYGLLGRKATHEGIDACFSLYDDDADAIAKSLGLNVRSPSDHGTTIVIVGFGDPRDPDKDMTEAAMDAVGLQMASEKNWFPAKLSGALEVKYIDTAGGAPPVDWAPEGPNFQLLEWLDRGLDEEKGPTIKHLPGRARNLSPRHTNESNWTLKSQEITPVTPQQESYVPRRC